MLFRSRTSETSCASFRFVKGFYFFPLDGFVFCDDQLGDSLSIIDDKFIFG